TAVCYGARAYADRGIPSNRGPSPRVIAIPEQPIEVNPNSAQPPISPPMPPVETERILLSPRGFEPQQISRPHGPVLLAVDSRTGLSSVTLRLDKLDGTRLREVTAPLHKAGWRDYFDLTPGSYTLTEASNPAWVCNITVTAH